MIASMTGFGLGEVEEDGLGVRVEVRSVNHRFLQIRHRLPPDFGELEPRIEALLRKRLSRGAVSTSLSLSQEKGVQKVVFDEELAARYRKLLGKAAARLELEDDLSLSRLVSLPGVLGTRVDPKDREREERALLRAAGIALDRLIESRAADGSALERDIRKHIAVVSRLLARVEKRMPLLVKAHQEGLARRVSQLLGEGVRIEPVDLAREIALLADRSDVSEEVARLKSHLEQTTALLDKGGPCGRELEFLVQELLRETNTIGSKCNDAPVAQIVVQMKTAIERIREQVQNVE